VPRPKPSAREAQSERIRNALLQSCADLLCEKPIDAITINEIVDRAGVAKGSFYNHFPDKEALHATISATILSEVESQVRANNENVEDPAYRLTRGMCTHIRLALAEPRRAIIMLRGQDWATSGQHELYKNVRNDIAQGVACGRFAQRCKDVGVLQVIGTGYFCMLRILERQMSPRAAVDLATRAFALTLCGFGIEEDEATRIASTSAKAIIRR
jgi:AcrR family transcriptional regulator